MQPTFRRRKFRLLRPALQIRLMVAFGGIALLALGLQFLLFQRAIGEAALAMHGSDAVVVERLAGDLVTTLLVSIGVLLPAVVAVGTSVVLRFVGPLYRFETYLREVLAGRDPGSLRLRRGDDLQDLAGLIDRVAEPVRTGAVRSAPDSPGAPTADERRAA
jgi:hypothetical protein